MRKLSEVIRMIKKNLNDYLCNSDYSIFNIDAHNTGKHHLKDILEDTGEYHEEMCENAILRLRALGNLTLDEYFQHVPNEVDILSDLAPFSEYGDIGDMTFSDVCNIIGRFANINGQDEEVVKAICILMEPIIDSSYNHPLYSSSIKHILDVSYDLTHDDHCKSTLNEDLLKMNMNDFVRMFRRKKGLEGCYPHFFNCILIPLLCLRSTGAI